MLLAKRIFSGFDGCPLVLLVILHMHLLAAPKSSLFFRTCSFFSFFFFPHFGFAPFGSSRFFLPPFGFAFPPQTTQPSPSPRRRRRFFSLSGHEGEAGGPPRQAAGLRRPSHPRRGAGGDLGGAEAGAGGRALRAGGGGVWVGCGWGVGRGVGGVWVGVGWGWGWGRGWGWGCGV